MINDYPSLVDAITRWLARSDLGASIPDFISLSENRMRQELRLRQQQKSLAGDSIAGTIQLPSDLRQIESLFITAFGREIPIYPVPPTKAPLDSLRPIPAGYWIDDNFVMLNGTNDVPYRLVYFQDIPPLSVASPSNWLLLESPNAYLYGALMEAAPFIRDDSSVATWSAAYQGAMSALKAQDDYYRYGPSPRQKTDMYVV